MSFENRVMKTKLFLNQTSPYSLQRSADSAFKPLMLLTLLPLKNLELLSPYTLKFHNSYLSYMV